MDYVGASQLLKAIAFDIYHPSQERDTLIESCRLIEVEIRQQFGDDVWQEYFPG